MSTTFGHQLATPMDRPSVFLSHSHSEKRTATSLQEVIAKNGGNTFLDQDKLFAGDTLSAALQMAIQACDIFLLIWSSNAARSSFVEQEWMYARQLRKRIVPYRLDLAPLPRELSDLIYIDSADQYRSHAELLRAVFGVNFVSPAGEIVPGLWRIVVKISGLGAIAHDIFLRPNGQVTGTCYVAESGALGLLGKIPGFRRLVRTRGDVGGTWKSEPVTRILTLNLRFFGLGQSTSETYEIHLSGYSKGAIFGEDVAQRQYILTRLAEGAPSDA